MGHSKSGQRFGVAKVGHTSTFSLPPFTGHLGAPGMLLHRNKDSSPAIVYTARPGNIDVPAPRSRRRWPRKVVGRLRRHRS